MEGTQETRGEGRKDEERTGCRYVFPSLRGKGEGEKNRSFLSWILVDPRMVMMNGKDETERKHLAAFFFVRGVRLWVVQQLVRSWGRE